MSPLSFGMRMINPELESKCKTLDASKPTTIRRDLSDLMFSNINSCNVGKTVWHKEAGFGTVIHSDHMQRLNLSLQKDENWYGDVNVCQAYFYKTQAYLALKTSDRPYASDESLQGCPVMLGHPVFIEAKIDAGALYNGQRVLGVRKEKDGVYLFLSKDKNIKMYELTADRNIETLQNKTYTIKIQEQDVIRDIQEHLARGTKPDYRFSVKTIECAHSERFDKTHTCYEPVNQLIEQARRQREEKDPNATSKSR